jgi:hypothetical protein
LTIIPVPNKETITDTVTVTVTVKGN